MKGLDYLYIILLMLACYLFANINFAKVISRLKKKDITKEGSGNPGTLNMLRTFGFFWAITNMTLEILKGVLPSLIGYLCYGDVGLYLCGFSAILGHIYPVLFKFKGGKGVACSCGMFFVANWQMALIALIVCFTFVTITSMGSIGTLGFVMIMALVEIAVFLVVQFVEGQFIYPRVVGDSVGLPAIFTLIAAILGGEMFGVLGMIFAIPLTAVIYTLLRDMYNEKEAKEIPIVEVEIEQDDIETVEEIEDDESETD